MWAAKRLLVAGKQQRDSVKPAVTQKWKWRVLTYKTFGLLNLLFLLHVTVSKNPGLYPWAGP